MLDPSYYAGREQTYVKHFVLETYLERVAWIIFSFRPDFVYVDGFSGPWKSENERKPFNELKAAIDSINDVELSAIHGAFEDHIDDIQSFAARSFSLIFCRPHWMAGVCDGKNFTPAPPTRGSPYQLHVRFHQSIYR